MRVKFSLNHRQGGGTKFYLTNYLYLFDFMDIGCLMSFGHELLSRCLIFY